MRFGFTGTQIGMTVAQRFTFADLLREYKPEALHHGDCIGADAGAHSIACDLDVPIVIHPPLNPSKRAHCSPWVAIRHQKHYLDRNKDIVMETQRIIYSPPKWFGDQPLYNALAYMWREEEKLLLEQEAMARRRVA
jgi:hypothetical protein